MLVNWLFLVLAVMVECLYRVRYLPNTSGPGRRRIATQHAKPAQKATRCLCRNPDNPQ
jgi:hypothetical protein